MTSTTSQLFEAICAGNIAMVKTLLESGVDCNSPSHEYYTYEREWSPLIMAIVYDRSDIVQVLIQAGADCLSFYNLSDRPESLLTSEIEAQLDELNVSCTALYTAVGFGNPSIVQMLLDAGAVVDNGDGNNTPLNLAIGQQNLAVIQQLISAGNDINIDMEDGERAVMTAANTGNLEIVKTLVDAGAELNTYSQGESALSLAAQGGHEEVYNYLLPLVSQEDRDSAPRDLLARGVKRKNHRNQQQ
ncbi:ankyrin repeat domain-containing protein [Acaryochloris sp. CCMEE 5410]|uniref:ankyrin repeat domain-containing protein n=1 Tax=Acaryochloris sp. CCMEE 5410 TaxID=310037 RepID=UPI0011119D61|nr:ankyrin repeat domain-containing protein [Acaryochloris sp. CCMEE 5410]KAI9134977.1 ankyrin repeat domain-containing protein [Acaryochloris sp. CCMEE 5410]